MTSRQRMIAAYLGKVPDRVPISPEIWTATVLEYAGGPFHRYIGPFATENFSEIWLKTQKYFGCDAWLLSSPEGTSEGGNFQIKSKPKFIDEETIQTEIDYLSTLGNLHAITRTNAEYDGWSVEHPVKDFKGDMPIMQQFLFPDPGKASSKKIEETIRLVGEEGLVSVTAGDLFISFLAAVREGSIAQTLLDISDYKEEVKELHKFYIGYLCKTVERLSKIPALDSILINCGYSDAGVIGPALYRTWEVPLLEAVAKTAREKNLIVHLHQHGKCRKVLADIAETGTHLVDSLERLSAHGDVDSLAEVKKEIGKKIALKGNIDPLNILKHGSEEDIRNQVRECIESAAGGGSYILSTGDSVISGTSFKNIEIMVETALKYGNYK